MVLQSSGSLSLSTAKAELFRPDIPVNIYNWYNQMTQAGTVTQSQSDPNVQIQLQNINYTGGGVYQAQRLQDYDSFTLSFELWNDSSAGGFGPGDGLSIYFGWNGSPGNAGVVPNNFSNYVQFYAYQYNGSIPRGIHLYDSTGARVVTNTTTTWLSAAAWYPVQIIYTKGTFNTWQLYFNGSLLWTYNDPLNNGWCSTTSGPYWGYGVGWGSATTNFYIRKVSVSTSNSPVMTLANPINWYSTMTSAALGSLTGSDPNVQSQLVLGVSTTSGYWYNTNFVTCSSFRFYAQVNISGSGDNYYINFGDTSAMNSSGYKIYFNLWSGYSNNGFSGTGIYILYNTVAVAYAAVSVGSVQNSWFNIDIVYNRSTTNTFLIYYNQSSGGTSTANLVYSDSLALSRTFGNFWGFGAYSGGGLTLSAWFRQVMFNYVPANVSLSLSQFRNIPGIGNTSSGISLSTFYNKMASNINGYTAATTLAIENGGPVTLGTDTAARYIWNTASSQTSAAGNVFIKFQITYNNTSGSNVMATLHVAADDVSVIYQNKIEIGRSNDYVGSYPIAIPVIISPGINLFEFMTWNGGPGANPAKLAFSCINGSNAVLFRSDNNTSTSLTNSSKTLTSVSITGSNSSSSYSNGNLPYFASRPVIINPLGVLDTISSAAKSSCSGAYACFRLSNNYTGPVMNLRRSSDNNTVDVYADLSGNLGLSANGTGTTFTAWITSNTAYVVTWYDQSGQGNHATQGTNSLQPIFDGNLLLIDSQNSSTQFLNIPSGTITTGVLNAPYTICFKHGTVNNPLGGFIGAGTTNNNSANNIRGGNNSGFGYWNYWWFNDIGFGANNRNSQNIVCARYDGTTRSGYVGNVLQNSAAASGYTVSAGQQYLFRTIAATDEYLNGQIHYMFVFRTALSDADRLKVCI